MPVYTYRCKKGHVHEELKGISERATNKCPECGVTAKLEITPVHLDYLHAGVDTGFPTLARKWDKLQKAKASGKVWDSNNLRYGGEYERSK